MTKAVKNVSIRWRWPWESAQYGERLRLVAGVSAHIVRTYVSPDYHPIQLIAIWIHVLAGALEVSLQLRPLTVYDWRSDGEGNA